MSEGQKDIASTMAWVEATVGGRVVAQRSQDRWRPTWFLDVEKPNGEVVPLVLRGFRNPGYMDEARSRAVLEKEAGLYKALEGTGVKVSRSYGYEPKGGWLLIERAKGTHELSKIEDLEVQRSIFHQYIDNMVLMHKLDYRELDLPPQIAPSKAEREEFTFDLALGNADGRVTDLISRPEPLFELCEWWFRTHRPPRPERLSLCMADMGAEQFMFHEGEFQVMFDIETACVSDPMLDACSMRNRDLCWPVPDLPHYVRYWAEQMGRELDPVSVTYWTLVCLYPLLPRTYSYMQKPDPRFPGDSMQLNLSDPHHRRGSAEALAEFYGIDLSPPARPERVQGRLSAIAELIGEQIRVSHVPHAAESEKYKLACTAALADCAALVQTAWPSAAAQTVDEIAEVLGFRPDGLEAGLDALQQRIRQDPEHDLHRILPVLHNMEVRREYMLEPIKALADYACNAPLQRM